MPIYEYKCRSCGALFEKLIRNNNDIPSACVECGATEIKKQFSTFSAAVASSQPSCADRGCAAAGDCAAAGRCPGGSCPF